MPMTERPRVSNWWRGPSLGLLPQFFEVKRYRVTVERRKNKYDRMVSLSEAVVVVKIGDRKMLSVSESMDEAGTDRGPVNALAKALAKDLGPWQAVIDDMRLVDFKVRITQGGTEAVTRVIIDSEDTSGAALADGRGFAEHRRREFRGAAGCDQLEADPGCRHAGGSGMNGRFALTLVLSLGACVAGETVVLPPEGTPFVAVSGGGGFSGWVTTTYFAGDLAKVSSYQPGDKTPKETIGRLPEGTYLRVRAVAEAGVAKAGRQATKEVCMDYGSDSVQISPPLGDLALVSAACPDDGILGLQTAIYDAAKG